MKAVLAIALVIAVFVGHSAGQSIPKPPIWPLKFMQTFNETCNFPVFGTQITNGTFIYDVSNTTDMRYRIDRANGRLDRWCMTATNIFKDAACNQYVVGGDRYIHYPKSDNTDYCCYCCSADHGCGVLKNTWTTTALFIGNDTMNGVPAFKWNIKGGQDNFYWETMVEDPTKRVMLDLFQTPDDDM